METRLSNQDEKIDLRPAGLDTHLGYSLRQVSNYVSGEFARELRARQTSVAEWVVLHQLQDRQGMSPSDLADALSLTRGAISKVLVKLSMKGWIAREFRADDNRAQVVSLTQPGRRALPQLIQIADRNDEKQFHCLNEVERSALRRILQKLTEFHQIRDVPVE